jgi:hypothetical protein
MERDLATASTRGESQPDETSLEGSSYDSGAEEWRLYSLFRPGAIYLHLYKPAAGSRPVRLSVAGLSPSARDSLTRLGRGQRVPREICEAAFRVNLLC